MFGNTEIFRGSNMFDFQQTIVQKRSHPSCIQMSPHIALFYSVTFKKLQLSFIAKLFDYNCIPVMTLSFVPLQ